MSIDEYLDALEALHAGRRGPSTRWIAAQLGVPPADVRRARQRRYNARSLQKPERRAKAAASEKAYRERLKTEDPAAWAAAQERRREYQRAWRARKKAEDPEGWRAQMAAQKRRYHAKRKAAAKKQTRDKQGGADAIGAVPKTIQPAALTDFQANVLRAVIRLGTGAPGPIATSLGYDPAHDGVRARVLDAISALKRRGDLAQNGTAVVAKRTPDGTPIAPPPEGEAAAEEVARFLSERSATKCPSALAHGAHYFRQQFGGARVNTVVADRI